MSKVGQVGHTGSEVGQTHFLGVKSWQDCDLEKWVTISQGERPKKRKEWATKTLAARAGATASVPSLLIRMSVIFSDHPDHRAHLSVLDNGAF
jgi:hypothetical protein